MFKNNPSAHQLYYCLVLKIMSADSGGRDNYFVAKWILAEGRAKPINKTPFLQHGITQRDFY